MDALSDHTEGTYGQPTPKEDPSPYSRPRSGSQRSSNRNSIKGFAQLLQEKHLKSDASDNEDATSEKSSGKKTYISSGKPNKLMQALHVKKVKQIM